VTEPVVVKTVSKCSVSAESETDASALSIKEVFRHEAAIMMIKNIVTALSRCFIASKVNEKALDGVG